jgi:hypothetical protein
MSEIRVYMDEDHLGIIVIPDQRCSIGEKVRRLAALLSRVSAEEMVNCMKYL